MNVGNKKFRVTKLVSSESDDSILVPLKEKKNTTRSSKENLDSSKTRCYKCGEKLLSSQYSLHMEKVHGNFKSSAREKRLAERNNKKVNGEPIVILPKKKEEKVVHTIEEVVLKCQHYSSSLKEILQKNELSSPRKKTNKETIDLLLDEPLNVVESPKKINAIKQPDNINGELKDYQIAGLNWLYTLHRQNLNGILADEMGLGKTVQTISLLALLHTKDSSLSHLVVVPTSTIYNWEREFKKWCPSLKIILYHGKQNERIDLQFKIEKKKKFNVLLTTYGMVSGKSDKSFLRRLNFCYLVLDEAQKVKNSESILHQTLLKLKTEHRLLLTGTPLQNNLIELWTLLHFLMPNVFGSISNFESLSKQIIKKKQNDNKMVLISNE